MNATASFSRGLLVRPTLQRVGFQSRSFVPPTLRSYATATTTPSRRSVGFSTKWVASLVGFTAVAVGWAYGNPSNPIALEQATNPDTFPLSSSATVIDKDTNVTLPLQLDPPVTRLPCGWGPLELIGYGVRTVSFLRVRVYLASLYLPTNPLPIIPTNEPLEEQMKLLMERGVPLVIRIIPVRSTDFSHLRDGFIRALQARLKLAIRDNLVVVDSETEQQFKTAIQQLKTDFPRGSIAKHSTLDLVITPSSQEEENKQSTISFEYKGQVICKIQPSSKGLTVARELVLAYLTDENQLSIPFKNSVQKGIGKLSV